MKNLDCFKPAFDCLLICLNVYGESALLSHATDWFDICKELNLDPDAFKEGLRVEVACVLKQLTDDYRWSVLCGKPDQKEFRINIALISKLL